MSKQDEVTAARNVAQVRTQLIGCGARVTTPLLMGWADEHCNTAAQTPRAVALKYPQFTDASVTAYLNGVDDAINRDNYRANLEIAKLTK